MCLSEMVKEREFSRSTFFFKRNLDVYLYFHSPGTEMWLTYYTFPFSVQSEKLHLSQDQTISGADIHISLSTDQQMGTSGKAMKSLVRIEKKPDYWPPFKSL